jgi:hypothetical protein
MMHSVQLSISDPVYAAAVREALSRSCAWHIESVERPDPSQHCALVLDEFAFAQLPRPVLNPERVVLITRKDPQFLTQAWDAGIISVVSEDDPVSTVLLAIMAAALRVAKCHGAALASGISPNATLPSAPIPPQYRDSGPKTVKSK